MREVSKATLFGDAGSTGDASNKLILQFNFPFQYGDSDLLISEDHDRMDYEHVQAVCRSRGEWNLPCCWSQADDKQVIALLKELLKVDERYPDVNYWTGYRITVSVNRHNGHPVYSFWLFALGFGSETEVYSDATAPNVEGGEIGNKNLSLDIRTHIG